MGEEIIMSTRLWTSGYDMFSPSQSVIGHMYGRPHQPKFWETVGSTLRSKKSTAMFGNNFVCFSLSILKLPVNLYDLFTLTGWA
jgi:hypothetical protein